MRWGGKRMRWWVAAMLGLALPGVAMPAWGQTILDTAALPPAARPLYSAFLDSNTHRVFAMDRAGHAGWFSGEYDTPAKVQDGALKLCVEHGGTDCQPYAVDLAVVWPGHEWRPPQPPASLVDTINYGFFPDDRFLWHGPAQAAGVVVWAHGGGGYDDSRGGEPAPAMRPFNNAGFDIVRYDRAPLVDNPVRAAGWLREELPVLRASGYRRVIVAGESRGGWTALQMLDTAGLADVVIAFSPAAHGSGASPNLTAQVDDLRRMMGEAEPARTRVAMVQFAHDMSAGDMDRRAALLTGLRTKEAAVLVVDRPDGFTGHFGWKSYEFGRRFGACLLHFATDPTPPASCPP